MMFSFAGKLLAFVFIVQICTSQQKQQSSLLRCLTGYKDSNGKLSDCPPGKVLSKCVSACPKTCQNPYVKSENKECLRFCRSGCVCPKGTVMDEGRHRECVPQDECTCSHHGKVYMPNQVLLRGGQKCQCKNGEWSCHDQPTSSRTCSVVGLTHVETFDGALLTVKPENYLLVKNIDKETKDFRIEASVHKNFKRTLKFIIGATTVVLADVHSIEVNHKKIAALPYHNNGVTIRQATSHFLLIESKDLNIAYDGNAVYVTLESFYRERVRGLCGSFDFHQDNDLRLPNGKLTCDTNVFSQGYVINDTKTKSSSEEEQPPKKFDRPKAEKSCRRIKDNVCKSDAHVHGLLLSCVEDHRHAEVNMNNRASCYWHSIFAHACALTGHDLPQKNLKWRSACEAVFGQCGAGTVYEECPDSCLNSCSDRDDESEFNSVCRQQCLAGCVCAKKNFYDTNQNRREPLKCKKESECSCFDEKTKSYHKPGTLVKRGHCSTCICLRGQLHCNSDKCNQSSVVCPNNLIFTETSLTACPKTCSNHLLWKNCHKYQSGCDCPKNMIRDENTNRCVYPKHCSCKLNKRVFAYGSKITKDVNECTCASGQWSCTKLDCSRTCSIIRNTHYTTFSGKYLKINSGSCQYIAARYKHHAKKFELVLNDDFSSKHGHSLQAHLVINGSNVTLGSDKSIRVNNIPVTTLASSPARYPTFTIHKAGSFAVVNGTHFILRWDFGNRIYLTVDHKWKGQLDGICSEHGHSSKSLFGHTKKHVNDYKVSKTCKVTTNKTHENEEQWKWAHEQCVDVLNGSASAKNSFSPCLDALSKERRKTLYQQCLDETCGCAIDAHDCPKVCSWYASLAELCRKEGHPIQSWRHDQFCPMPCENNEEYKSCGTLCQKTCDDLHKTSTVKCYNDTCNEGCYCKEGYVLNSAGDCVKPSECKGKPTVQPSSTPGPSSGSVTTAEVTSKSTSSAPKTTAATCTEAELIEILVRSNLIQTRPKDSSNKQDLIHKGLNLKNESLSLEIDLPNHGATVKNVKLHSKNVVEIEIIFVLESGLRTTPIRSSPKALPKDKYPAEKVRDIIINIVQLSDGNTAQDVTLSVIVCGEDLPSTTTVASTASSVTSGSQRSTRIDQTTSGSLGSTSPGKTASFHTEVTTGSQATTRTTPSTCTEIDFTENLISSNAIRIRPNDELNKRGLITIGLDIADKKPTFKIDLPEGGLHVRDVKVPSLNILKVEAVFLPALGTDSKSIQGAPTSLPTKEFPTGRTSGILIKVLETLSDDSVKQVKLSIIVCAESTSATSTHTTSQPKETIASTTSTQPTTTTAKFCDEMQYINTLVATKSIQTRPTDIANKNDLINKGVDFTDKYPTIVANLPANGAIIRNLALTSENIVQVEVIFTTVSGRETKAIRGAPTSLPTSEFPIEKVHQIVVRVVKTSDEIAPHGVTLSVIACASGSVVTSYSTGPTSTDRTRETSSSFTSQSPSTTASGGTPVSSTDVGTTPAATVLTRATSSIPSTTNFACDEMELIGILISNNAITITPVDLSNKEDLVRQGVSFTEKNPIFVINAPTNGARIRDLKIHSTNILEIEVVLTTVSGRRVNPIRGAPTALSKNEFPTEKVAEIIVIVKKTKDDASPKDVKLSVIACAEEVFTITPASTTSAPGSSKQSTRGTFQTASQTSIAPSTTSTASFCAEMEYINTLIATNSVKTTPTDVPNKGDLIKTGVNFADKNPSLVVIIPANGAIIRNVKLQSSNVAVVEITSKTESGRRTSSFRGAPGSFTSDQFPREKVIEIVVKVIETIDGDSPQDVTLSVIACAEGLPVSTPEGSTQGTTGSTQPSTRSSAVSSSGASGATTPVGQSSLTTSELTQITGTTKILTTTKPFCDEMEYITVLIATNSIGTTPTDIPNKNDLITNGVDFSDQLPTITISTPTAGTEVRDVKLSSNNVKTVQVDFITKSGSETKSVRGSPKALPTSHFPTEKVVKIVIKILETTNGNAPESVTLSVIACAEATTTASFTGTTLKTSGSGTPTFSTLLGTATSSRTDASASYRPSTTTSPAVTDVEEKCKTVRDLVTRPESAFSSVSINGEFQSSGVIPTSIVVHDVPLVISVQFKNPANLREVSVVNPAESKVSVIQVGTDQSDDELSTNPNAPKVTYDGDIEYVSQLTITIVQVQGSASSRQPVRLAVIGCARGSFWTKGVTENTVTRTKRTSPVPTRPITGQPLTTIIPTEVSTRPSSACNEEIAIILEESITAHSSRIPRYSVKPLAPYKPSDVNVGRNGVSFPPSDKTHIIIYPILSPSVIKSVRLSQTLNVDQMRVMFLNEEDEPIKGQAPEQSPLQLTSKLEKNPSVHVNLSLKVKYVHISLIHTNDKQPPQGVTVEIIVCAESSGTTATTRKGFTTPASNYTASTPTPSSPCKPKRKSPARITINGCVSEQEVQQESCAGFCPSYEELDPLSGNIAAKECLCCAPDSTYKESVLMNCQNTTSGQSSQRTTEIVRIRSCKCSMCLGTAKEQSANSPTSFRTLDNANRVKSKTRRR